jgi:Ca2+-binding RTX toxin-like protein
VQAILIGASGFVANHGQIVATAPDGTVVGIHTFETFRSDGQPAVTNAADGTITVHSAAGYAVGISAFNQNIELLNDGVIDVTGGDGAAGLDLGNAGGKVVNTGRVSVVSTSATQSSVGFSSYSNASLTNSGTIEADFSAVFTLRYDETVTLANSGTMTGTILISLPYQDAIYGNVSITNTGEIDGSIYTSNIAVTCEQINNSGTIRGNIFLYGGDDVYNGKDGQIFGVVHGGDGADRLIGGVNAVQLFGDAGNDTLVGTSFADRLDGGAGNDRMTGGAGDDRYGVDSAGDVIIEKAGDGTDTIESDISWRLGRNLENLTLLGNAALSGTGNGLGNTIFGNNGDNVLSGGDGNDHLEGLNGQDKIVGGSGNDELSGNAGNDRLFGGTGSDTLHGGLGKDLLIGGTGADFFVFDTAPDVPGNRDTIDDFHHAEGDQIELSAAIFGGIAHTGALAAEAFYSAPGASQAHDPTDRIIYNSATGVLYYDPDGAGGQAAIAFVSLKGAPDLMVTDFTIIM